MKRGLIHIYYGRGKGKTTASLGLILRSLGWKRKVCLFMFLKPKSSRLGEVESLRNFPGLKIYRYNQIHPYFWNKGKQNWKILLKEVKRAIQDLDKEIKENYDLIVLDEILNLLDLGLINKEYLLKTIGNRSSKTELVLTGRKCPIYLRKIADYLSEVRAVKHPYQRISARQGVEY